MQEDHKVDYQELSEEPSNVQPEISHFNISFDQVKICLEEGIDLSNLYALEAFREGTDLTKHHTSAKLESWKQTLIRKSLIDEHGIITIKGTEVLERIKNTISKKNAPKLPRNLSKEETAFERWWKTFPGTDVFEYKGKKFTGTRTFRKEKPECLILFNRIINSKNYTEEEMINAIKLEVQIKKEASITKNENQLKWLQNTATYLRQETYVSFIELLRKGVKIEEETVNIQVNQSKYGGVDI